jgi:hypothetical protein
MIALPNEADHWARAWLMALLDGAARAGLTPISHDTIHQMAFLANALAPVYDLPVENGLVTRWKRGPYSRGLQWDLDRLAIMGLARLAAVKSVTDDEGAWFKARYGLGPLAQDFMLKALQVPSLRRVHTFHCELMAAYASLPEAFRGMAATEDATYANTFDGDLDEGETVIDFAAWRDRNFTQRASMTLERQLRGFAVNPRSRIHIYLRYLARRASSVRYSS